MDSGICYGVVSWKSILWILIEAFSLKHALNSKKKNMTLLHTTSLLDELPLSSICHRLAKLVIKPYPNPGKSGTCHVPLLADKAALDAGVEHPDGDEGTAHSSLSFSQPIVLSSTFIMLKSFAPSRSLLAALSSRAFSTGARSQCLSVVRRNIPAATRTVTRRGFTSSSELRAQRTVEEQKSKYKSGVCISLSLQPFGYMLNHCFQQVTTNISHSHSHGKQDSSSSALVPP